MSYGLLLANAGFSVPWSSPQAFSREFLAEVQTKMDRHQRELLQRLNFQDEAEHGSDKPCRKS